MAFLAPFIAGIGAATSAIAATTVGSLALRLGGSLLLSAVARKVAPKPNMAGLATRQPLGVKVTGRAAVAARDMVYGQVRKGGTIFLMDVSEAPGAPNGFLDLIVTVAGHRVEEIGAIYFDGEIAVPANDSQGAWRWAGYVGVDRHLGDPDGSAFPTLRVEKPGLWTEFHRVRGVAAIWLRLIYTQDRGPDVWPGGLPNITFDVKGKNDILDPRTGLRGYSTNAALCVADYMAHPHYGLRAEIGRNIDTLDLIEAANICDEPVALATGGTEPRYTCNGVVDLSPAPKANIESLLTAMQGQIPYVGGRFFIQAGAYRAPVMALTVDDAAPGGIRVRTRQSMAENFNAVRGTFISPENDWQPDDFPAVRSAVYLAEDEGEERWDDVAFPFTTSSAMAQRLARIQLEKQRRQITVEFRGKLKCWAAQPGDTVTLTYPRRGWVAKPFRVERVRVEMQGGALVPMLTLRETSPLVYSWTATEEQIYAAAPRTRLPSAFDVTPPGIVSVNEELYITNRGDGVKTRVTIGLSAASEWALTGYEVEGQRDGGAWVSIARNGGETVVEMLDATPGAWLFRARAINAVGVRSDWSPTFAYTVLGRAAPPGALTGASIMQIGGQALLRWDQAPELDVQIGGHIVIRHSTAPVPTWAGGLSVARVAGASTTVIVPLMPGSYLLRARDASGNLGPMAVLSAEGVQALPFQPIGTLQEDDEFAGAHGGTFASAGSLQLGSGADLWPSANLWAEPDLWIIGGQVLPQGIYDFATVLNFGAVKTVRLRRVVRMIPVQINGDIWAEPDLWAMADLYASVSDEVDVRVEISTTQDSPIGSPAWSDWRPLEADEVTARGVRARAVLTTSNPLVTPRVDRLRIEAHEVTL